MMAMTLKVMFMSQSHVESALSGSMIDQQIDGRREKWNSRFRLDYGFDKSSVDFSDRHSVKFWIVCCIILMPNNPKQLFLVVQF